MISVKYSETTLCIYSNYGCRDVACPLNKLHKPKEATLGITDIKCPGCIKIMDIIFDEDLDDSIRENIKATIIEGKFHHTPQAIRDIGEGISPKITPPLVRRMRGENVSVGPGVVVPDDR
jgi:hypothetical protein